MLESLHIENIAVIERGDIQFAGGFNVLTGETGAGKSIVIDSIDAVLGGRVSRDIVRRGAEKALVSAVFTDVDVADWMDENDIDDEEELIIQRRVGADGKSACRVNGVPVTVQQLRSLGALLLDIHGQNDGRQLLDEARHLEYLDGFVSPTEEKQAYEAAYTKYRQIKKEIDRLSMDEVERERLIDSLRYQIEELEKAQLRDGEEEELTSRRSLMKNAGKLTEALDAAYEALYEGDSSAISLSSDAEGWTERASAYAPELSDALKSISEARFMLEDAAERINDLRSSLDFSAEEFDRMESRLALIHRLERKYGKDEAELIAHLEECREKLERMDGAGDLLAQLEKELERSRVQVITAGKALTKRRRDGAELLAQRIISQLRYLNMPSVRFETEILPIGGKTGFDSTGCDQVRFLMSANAGEEPGRISRIASGGELSRIMLAMKSVFADGDRVGSLIFDEIDTGVSGIAAQRVGEKIGELSRSKQIICVTHLPQIAAMADAHYHIEKTESDGRTYTRLTRLDREGRLHELARLYGGDIVTDTTLLSAEEQLSAAEKFKSER